MCRPRRSGSEEHEFRDIEAARNGRGLHNVGHAKANCASLEICRVFSTATEDARLYTDSCMILSRAGHSAAL